MITLHGHGHPVHVNAHQLRMWLLSRFVMFTASQEVGLDRVLMECVLDPNADLEELFNSRVDVDFGGDFDAAARDLEWWFDALGERLPPLPYAEVCEEHGGSD